MITRVFDAPRDLVFRVWTDPAHVARWWGPKDFTNPRCELDVRPGGAIHIDMRSPDGTVYPMKGVFAEIVAPERLVFSSSALDENGAALFEVLTTVTFVDEGGKTKLTMRAHVTKTTPGAQMYLEGMETGWTQSLQRLADHLANKA
ncbi:MAG TPA: SRPBCC domain-containing protein [Candidatus Tyrphobacter sp.]